MQCTENITTEETMSLDPYSSLFTVQTLEKVFPAGRADAFFEALFGDAEEGAYDIRLAYAGFDPAANTLRLELQLHQRPGKCLACNLTYGLPEVFSRHPIINLKGVADTLCGMLPEAKMCGGWELLTTVQHSREMHAIPFLVKIA